MANNENLKPFSKENAKYYGKKGGTKSAKVRAERKSIKEQLKLLMEMPITSESRLNQLKMAGFKEDEATNQLYLTYSLFEKALTGDTKAISIIFKTLQNEDEEKTSSFNDCLNDLFTY